MRMYLDHLIHVATAHIDGHYFQTQSVGGKSKWLERPYAYEFYHQMKTFWPDRAEDNCPIISGEVSKAGHELFEELDAGKPIPDFLIHTPGNMENNCAVIEIKHQRATLTGIRNDINKLRNFKEKIRYKRAIYLFFGYKLPVDPMCIPQGIELWHHASPNKPALRVNWPRDFGE